MSFLNPRTHPEPEEPTVYDTPDSNTLTGLLEGRRVVEVTEQQVPGRYGYGTDTLQVMVLDNGTRLAVRPNEGCGGCSSGWYDVQHLATVDNVITRAEAVIEDLDEYDAHAYRVFVFTGNERINLLSVEGDDGNGYYGTGYELQVVPHA